MKKLITSILLTINLLPVMAAMPKALIDINHIGNPSSVIGTVSVDYQVGSQSVTATEDPVYKSIDGFTAILVGDIQKKKVNLISIAFNENTNFTVGSSYEINNGKNASGDLQLAILNLKQIDANHIIGYKTMHRSGVSGTITIDSIENGNVNGSFEATLPIKSLSIERGAPAQYSSTARKTLVQGRFSIPQYLINTSP